MSPGLRPPSPSRCRALEEESPPQAPRETPGELAGSSHSGEDAPGDLGWKGAERRARVTDERATGPERAGGRCASGPGAGPGAQAGDHIWTGHLHQVSKPTQNCSGRPSARCRSLRPRSSGRLCCDKYARPPLLYTGTDSSLAAASVTRGARTAGRWQIRHKLT